LLDSPYVVKAVVTRPDKPSGRGRPLGMTPVKEAAIAAGLPVLQPASLRRPEAIEQILAIGADFIVVAAYGLIIPPEILSLPPRGVLNVHPSLLPRHRGASPIPAAILSGDDETGVTIMLMDEGLDTGPILAQRTFAIDGGVSAQDLAVALADLSADLLSETLPKWIDGKLQPRPQDNAKATYFGQVTPEDARIDWAQSAEVNWRKVRAFNPSPGAWTTLKQSRLLVWRAWPLEDTKGRPGEVLGLQNVDLPAEEEGAGVVVGCGSGALALLSLQKEGRRVLDAAKFARGERGLFGAVLGGAAANLNP
jgi:methionyl-tRNA formyltransferase